MMTKGKFNPLSKPAARQTAKKKAEKKAEKALRKRANPMALTRPQKKTRTKKQPQPSKPNVPSKILLPMSVKVEELVLAIESNEALSRYVLNRLHMARPHIYLQVLNMKREERLVMKYAFDKDEGVVNFSADEDCMDDDEDDDSEGSQPKKQNIVSAAFIKKYVKNPKFAAQDAKLGLAKKDCVKSIPAKFLSYAEAAEKFIDADEMFEKDALVEETTGMKWASYQPTMRLQLLFSMKPSTYDITMEAFDNPRDLWNTRAGIDKVTQLIKNGLKNTRRKTTKLEILFHKVYPWFKVKSKLPFRTE